MVAVSTAAIYLFLTALLRIFGRRQLGQLTVIDVVVVLLLGSSVETAMIHGDVTLPAGLVCAATLLVVNRTLTRVLFRRPRLVKLIDGEPVLLINEGKPVAEHLRRAGMTERDLGQALRTHGYSKASEVRYATLEPDGSVSMIPRDPEAHGRA